MPIHNFLHIFEDSLDFKGFNKVMKYKSIFIIFQIWLKTFKKSS